jgi:hypothetical protein
MSFEYPSKSSWKPKLGPVIVPEKVIDAPSIANLEPLPPAPVFAEPAPAPVPVPAPAPAPAPVHNTNPMTISVHIHPELPHQKEYADALMEGMKLEGDLPEYAPFNQFQHSEVAVVWGWVQKNIIRHHKNILSFETGNLVSSCFLAWNNVNAIGSEARNWTLEELRNGTAWRFMKKQHTFQ